MCSTQVPNLNIFGTECFVSPILYQSSTVRESRSQAFSQPEGKGKGGNGTFQAPGLLHSNGIRRYPYQARCFALGK